LEALVGIEPTMAELQSTALPLCYSATKMWTFKNRLRPGR
jgi:hypothetical protein